MTGRLAMLSNSFAGGGAERSSLLIASSWPDPSDITLVVCDAEGPFATLVPDALDTTEIGVWPNMGRLLPFSRRLDAIAFTREVGRMIVNGYGLTHMVLMAQMLGLSGRTRVVVVERNTLSVAIRDRFPNILTRWVILRLTRWLYRRAEAIVGVSEGVSRDLERTLRLPINSVTTIYNPVDTDHITRAIGNTVPESLMSAFDALPRPIVITTGRLVRAKAHRDLLIAFTDLPAEQRGSLVILGEGPLRQDLEQQAEQLGIRDRIWMPGFVDNPWWFIARSDAFALSSHWEGHPRAILEALACRVPIASTDCPSGPRELLADTPGTRLTPVGDTQALSESILHLLTHPTIPDIDLSPYTPHHIAHQYAALMLSTSE